MATRSKTPSPQVFVMFSDETKKLVVASFGCPQDEAVYPYQDTLDDTDPRYLAFVATLPVPLHV